MKRISLLLWAITPVLFTSCEFDDSGDVHISGFGWLLIVGFCAFLVYSIIKVNTERSTSETKMKAQGMDYSQFISLGTYGGGHPELDKTIEGMYCRKEDGNISLYNIPMMTVSMPDKVASIPIDSISNITIEDSSSIEKKITVGRIFLVGIFALGWKKKKKNELAFLIIEWKKGKFEHSTIFSFENQDAFQNANISRNKLIAYCDTEIPN